MRLLLDTHVLLWWLGDIPRLGSKARALIEDTTNELMFSVASPWEMAIKVGQGRLRIDMESAITAFDSAGLIRLDITSGHLAALAGLERLHGDPFDRMIVVQAMVEGATIMTQDGAIPRYPVVTIGCD
ncbi:PIN domain nuclease of toxin-antitoxin system [Sphingomonas sp. UYAg733]